ncbi:MAG: hypothetical protein Q4P22_07905 [Eubacteriales bacterium]|nr:hypothetical protein [Eubacteriales bacterium]
MNKAKALILKTIKEAVDRRDPRKLDRAADMARREYSLGTITDNDMASIAKHILECRIFCK